MSFLTALNSVAMWWCVVMHWSQVVEGVVVSCFNVVNGIGTRSAAYVAGSAVPL